MGRRVKCQDTGEYSTSDCTYRATNGRYWSSEAAYRHYLDQQEWYRKSVKLLMVELEYDDSFVPTLIMKNIKKYERVGYDVVYDTICQQHNAIMWALQNKTFDKEYYKITYIFKIIDNNILDVYHAKKHNEEQKKINEAMIVPQDDNINNKKQATRDISRFLED